MTKKQMDSPRGETLKEIFPGTGELIGHWAIRDYYDIIGGQDRECTDFSTPKNFPASIAKAIKAGKFRGCATPDVLLSQTARAEYHKVCQAAWAEYYKVYQIERVEYDEVCQTTFWDLFAIPSNRNPLWR